MSYKFNIGDRVRIAPSYGDLGWLPKEIGKNAVGTEFTVEKVKTSHGYRLGYVTGDPARRGIWDEYLELVASAESKDMDLEAGKAYFLNYADGSRVRVEVEEGKYGDIDARNDLVDFSMWTGRKGIPMNRLHIESIVEVKP